jgi:hypothetical protein
MGQMKASLCLYTLPPTRLHLCYLKVALRPPQANIQQTYALPSQPLILECGSRRFIPLILTHLWPEEEAKGGRGQLEEMDGMGLTRRKKPGANIGPTPEKNHRLWLFYTSLI